MLSIDEAIEQFKYNAECNRTDLDLSYAEENEQVEEWLEELKAYNKAIDDFIHECDKYCEFYGGKNKNITREDILKIAEQLKERE